MTLVFFNGNLINGIFSSSLHKAKFQNRKHSSYFSIILSEQCISSDPSTETQKIGQTPASCLTTTLPLVAPTSLLLQFDIFPLGL